MIDKRWNRNQESKQREQNQTANKVVWLSNKVKSNLIRKQDILDKPTLQSLETNSDNKPGSFAFESIIYAHIHESKFGSILA